MLIYLHLKKWGVGGGWLKGADENDTVVTLLEISEYIFHW